MADVIYLFGKGKTATLSETKKRAYHFKGQCAEQIMINAQLAGVEIPDLIEPFAQFLATLVAVARVTGNTVDVDALLKTFPDEVSGMTKLLMERAGQSGMPT